MELIYTERAFLDGPIQSHGIVGISESFWHRCRGRCGGEETLHRISSRKFPVKNFLPLRGEEPSTLKSPS